MEPTTTLDARFSDREAAPTPWPVAEQELARAGIYWISTVRVDGRPHVTPLIGVWYGDALHFCTGPDEQKARNLAANRRCILTTGANTYETGLDVVVEGDAVRVDGDDELRALADAYVDKYGEEWRFQVADGAFRHDDGGVAWVFRVEPVKALGFSRDVAGQTRWRF